MSEALDRYYADRDLVVRIRRHGAALRHTVSTALSRSQNKYAAFLETIQQSDSLDLARQNGELLLVAHTVWDDTGGVEVIRIISARRAEPKERRRYEQNRSL